MYFQRENTFPLRDDIHPEVCKKNTSLHVKCLSLLFIDDITGLLQERQNLPFRTRLYFWFPRKNLDYNKVWSFGIKPCSNVQIRVFWGILPCQMHEGEKDLRIIYTNVRVLSCLCTQPGASELFIYPAVTYAQFRIPDKCRFKANFHFNVFVKLPPPD